MQDAYLYNANADEMEYAKLLLPAGHQPYKIY